ncbi:MAG: MFS transporter, partial [Pseudomonadota bacterium]
MKRTLRQWVVMAVLSFSGGVVFILPFLQEVYYEPLTEALGINNTEVGALMSVFGITSMIAYLPGGWLADRVSPRWLISLSLIATGLGGLYFATFPPYRISLAIHAVWGVTIALLFWGAMIRATREWGGKDDPGKAFGILETGRGIGEIVGYLGLGVVFVWLGGQIFAFSTVVIIMSAMLIVLG